MVSLTLPFFTSCTVPKKHFTDTNRQYGYNDPKDVLDGRVDRKGASLQ